MQIFNSLSNKREKFVPIEKGKVGMYVCGPTVYDEPHIGHARSAYVFDVIRRYFTYCKFEVTFVRNVTDVDDKIIDKGRQEYKGGDLKEAVKKVSLKYLKVYHDDMEHLGILKPDKEPKAAEYIDKMIEFIKILIDRGVAYTSGGDVYFDITQAKDYGKLSNQSVDKMKVGARISPGENKKGPLDFALWKKAKEDEPSWPSPWGEGRPGWHIECSVMSSDILGDEFDIHGGGRDLIFPHHENEIAQSEGAGKKFARCWIHNGLLTINGEKMAKSSGNFITIKDFMQRYNRDVLKFFFLSAHYSQPINFTWDRIKEKQKALYKIITFLKFVKQRGKGGESYVKTDLKKKVSPQELRIGIKKAREDFTKSMDDDFNTPNAVAVLFEVVNICNRVLFDVGYTKDHLSALKYGKQTIEEIGDIFGLSFEETPLSMPDDEIRKLAEDRERLRKQKMFKEADEIREGLKEKGVVLEDVRGGKTTWRRKLS